jgi:heptosyltransferase III
LDADRLIIFLLGSLGDTIVALPALHLIARRFPAAERRVLTNIGTDAKMVPMAALLEGTGLVHGFYHFPAPGQGTARARQLAELAADIRRWKPDALIYLHEQRGRRIALRDAAIFKLLGIPRLIGIPWSGELQRRVFNADRGLLEHRAEYLARSLAELGDPMLESRSSWDLALSASDRAGAQRELAPMRACPGLLAMSIGTKVDANDWGDEKWRALLKELNAKLPSWGLVALGAPVESARTEALLAAWQGPRLNLCGKIPIRESAAVLERARVFIGHDSGPMHLAAAVGTPCAAVFSARNLPGTWFPYGKTHTVFYKRTACAGCGLDVCVEFAKQCINSVSAMEVASAVLRMVSATDLVAEAAGART